LAAVCRLAAKVSFGMAADGCWQQLASWLLRLSAGSFGLQLQTLADCNLKAGCQGYQQVQFDCLQSLVGCSLHAGC